MCRGGQVVVGGGRSETRGEWAEGNRRGKEEGTS